MPAKQTREIYALVALGLLVIQLAAFAIIYPFTLPKGDDWLYVYLGHNIYEEHDIFFTHANRQFGTLNLAIARLLFPDRVQAMFYLHVLSLYAISLGLFHLMRRLKPGYEWFAFLFACVYLLYIPQNIDHITIWLAPYSWVLLLCVTASVFFVENLRRTGLFAWGMLILGGLLGYMTSRAYEGTVILMGFIPILVWLAGKFIFTRKLIIAAAIWWVFIGVGALQFAVPYASEDEDAWYQTSKISTDEVTLDYLWTNTSAYYKRSFMIDDVYPQNEQFHSLPLALIIVGAFLSVTLLFFRRYPDTTLLPSPKALLVMGGMGLLFIGMGGIGYIYADLVPNARSLFFAAPGQALVITSGFSLIAFALHRLLKIAPMVSLLCISCVFLAIGSQWFYNHANNWYTWYVGGSFDERGYIFQDFVALFPEVENNTLIMAFNCDTHFKPTRRTFSVRYLYGYIDGSEIQLLPYIPELNKFDQTGAVVPPPITSEIEPTKHFDYDQLVLVTCENESLYLLEHFPAGFAPDGATIDEYNPHARLLGGFIPPERWRILARS